MPAPATKAPLDPQGPFPWRPALLVALVALLIGVLFIQIKRAQAEQQPVKLSTVPKKKKPRKPHPPAADSVKPAMRNPASAAAADSTGGNPGSAPVTSEGALPAADPAGAPEDAEDMEAYSFARLRWESPGSKELAERVNRLGDGFDGRPVGKFHAVQGRTAFLRLSTLVNPSEDRKMDRIPESSISEYLPEWYQRGFTLHARGPFHRFSPKLFRLRHPPGWKPDTSEEGRLRPVKYQVQAYVEEEGGLLLYPDAKDREGDNGFREPADFKAEGDDPVFSAAYFRNLTRGKVEAVKRYDFPDKGFGLVEVFARRRAPAGLAPGADSLKSRSGAYLFLIKPAEKKIAFLAHDFDGRFCPEDKKIRFQGTLDVDGDDNAELLLGPRPLFLVREDLEGLKYDFEDGYKCSP